MVPGGGDNYNLHCILTMAWCGKQTRSFSLHFADKKTSSKMLLDLCTFTQIKARVLILISYISHLSCLCERKLKILSLVHCELLWREKNTHFTLCFDDVFNRSYDLGDCNVRNTLENDSHPMFVYKRILFSVSEMVPYICGPIHFEIAPDLLWFSRKRWLRVGIWSGWREDPFHARENLELTCVSVLQSPSSSLELLLWTEQSLELGTYTTLITAYVKFA